MTSQCQPRRPWVARHKVAAAIGAVLCAVAVVLGLRAWLSSFPMTRLLHRGDIVAQTNSLFRQDGRHVRRAVTRSDGRTSITMEFKHDMFAKDDVGSLTVSHDGILYRFYPSFMNDEIWGFVDTVGDPGGSDASDISVDITKDQHVEVKGDPREKLRKSRSQIAKFALSAAWKALDTAADNW